MKPLMLALLLLPLAACATIQGAGQDIQSAGSAVSQEAKRAESRM